jgi:integrase/recombinase XerD
MMIQFKHLLAAFDALDGVYAQNTLRAYRADNRGFHAFCTTGLRDSYPADADTVIAYIEYLSDQHRYSSISRAVTAVHAAHLALELPSPCRSRAVQIAMKRIARRKGRAQSQALGMTHTLRDTLLHVTDTSLSGARDRVLLRLAYESMRRRSELTSLRIEDLAPRPDGSGLLVLRRSKTDQEGVGFQIILSKTCVQTIHTWLDRAELDSGPILRSVTHHHVVGRSLSPGSVARIYKRLARRAGCSEDIVSRLSGHSTRVGAAQDLVSRGDSLPQIMRRGGWKSPEIVSRYTILTALDPMEL